jgi:hypothetical protein
VKASIIIAAILLFAGSAKAEVYYRGKVYQITADRIIAERQLQCSYGPWRSQTEPNGTTVIIRDKVCTNERKGN